MRERTGAKRGAIAERTSPLVLVVLAIAAAAVLMAIGGPTPGGAATPVPASSCTPAQQNWQQNTYNGSSEWLNYSAYSFQPVWTPAEMVLVIAHIHGVNFSVSSTGTTWTREASVADQGIAVQMWLARDPYQTSSAPVGIHINWTYEDPGTKIAIGAMFDEVYCYAGLLADSGYLNYGQVGAGWPSEYWLPYSNINDTHGVDGATSWPTTHQQTIVLEYAVLESTYSTPTENYWINQGQSEYTNGSWSHNESANTTTAGGDRLSVGMSEMSTGVLVTTPQTDPYMVADDPSGSSELALLLYEVVVT